MKSKAQTRLWVKTFKARFAPLVKSGEKLQTIRPRSKCGMPKVGDPISLREWTGLPRRSKQRVLGESVIKSVEPIVINIEGIKNGRGWIREEENLTRFARRDGFRDWQEMALWFDKEHGLPFAGILIIWEKPVCPCPF